MNYFDANFEVFSGLLSFSMGKASLGSIIKDVPDLKTVPVFYYIIIIHNKLLLRYMKCFVYVLFFKTNCLPSIVKVLQLLQYITRDTKKVRQDGNIDDIYHLFVNRVNR